MPFSFVKVLRSPKNMKNVLKRFAVFFIDEIKTLKMICYEACIRIIRAVNEPLPSN